MVDGGQRDGDDDISSADSADSLPSQLLAPADSLTSDHLLRESALLFRSLVASAPDALLISDEAGVILLANRVAESLFGYGNGELRGTSIDALVPPRSRDDHAEHRASYFLSPTVRAMGSFRELTARRRDGTDVPVEVSLSPVHTPLGTLVTSIVRDISARRRVEETLRLQAVAISSAANGVVITDREGVMLWVNPAFCRMTGWEFAELVGRHTRILKSGRHDDAFYRQLWTTICAGNTWHGEIINARKDGTHYVEDQTIAPVPDERGQITHFIAIKNDVTERRREQAEIERLHERLKVELADAADFVRSVLPTPATFGGASVDWVFRPSTELGGDGLGYHARDDGTLAMYLLDVCGHGLAAALLSVAVLTALRSGRLDGANDPDPRRLLSSLNAAFPTSTHGGLHFTVWFGIFDPATGLLRHASAGHPPPLLVEPGRPGRELGEAGPMIGVAADASWTTAEDTLPPGSQLFVFSDGAYELTRRDGTLLPYDDFVRAVEAAAATSEPLSSLTSFAEATCGATSFDDDVSVLLLCMPLAGVAT